MALPRPCYNCGERIPDRTRVQKLCEDCKTVNRRIAARKRSVTMLAKGGSLNG